jgi:hypothetical protein
LITCLRHVLRHTVSLDGCSWIDGLKLPGPGDGCRPPIPGASGSGCCRAHSRGDYRPLRGGSRAPAAGSGCQGNRIVGFAIWVDMRPGICLGCRGPRRFPPLPSLPQGPTCVWLGGGAAAGRIPRSQRTPRLAGKPSRRSEGTQAGRREKSTVGPERKGISSDSTVGSQFPPMPYNVSRAAGSAPRRLPNGREPKASRGRPAVIRKSAAGYVQFCLDPYCSSHASRIFAGQEKAYFE